jgi:uncharacterized protein YjiK
MTPRAAILLFGLASTAIGCRADRQRTMHRADTLELAAREERLSRALANAADSDSTTPLARWIMPRDLGEISGLALAADGRLLTHDDEQGRITVIDPRRGVTLKRFWIGQSVRADFEGITDVNGTIYLITSNGKLYEFPEGDDGDHVRYSVYDTHLGDSCEFEGVAFDSSTNTLLLPCKNVRQRQLRDQLVIYRLRLRKSDTLRDSMIAIPMQRIVGNTGWKGFHPSDITIDPVSGDYVMVAGPEKGLVEINPLGVVVRSEPLPGKHHRAEGVAITRDGLLIVSDEASNSTPAVITLYRWRTAARTVTTTVAP